MSPGYIYTTRDTQDTWLGPYQRRLKNVHNYSVFLWTIASFNLLLLGNAWQLSVQLFPTFKTLKRNLIADSISHDRNTTSCICLVIDHQYKVELILLDVLCNFFLFHFMPNFIYLP